MLPHTQWRLVEVDLRSLGISLVGREGICTFTAYAGALQALGFTHIQPTQWLAEREGFEPPGLLHPSVFKTAAISQTLPPLQFLAEATGFEPVRPCDLPG